MMRRQFSWAMDCTSTPLKMTDRAAQDSKKDRTAGRSAWSTKERSPKVSRPARRSMSTKGLANSVAKTRVGSQPP
jgi:hypothetical protein